jgi:hypothetical protein
MVNANFVTEVLRSLKKKELNVDKRDWFFVLLYREYILVKAAIPVQVYKNRPKSLAHCLFNLSMVGLFLLTCPCPWRAFETGDRVT